MKIVKLYGALASKFGGSHSLDVRSAGEAFRALCALYPDFQREFLKHDWGIMVGSKDKLRRVSLDTINLGAGRAAKEIHFLPSGWRLAGLEPLTIAAIAIIAVVAVAALAISVSIPTESATDREDQRTSFLFDGAVNRFEQGHPIPMVYGRMMTGSVVVASSLETATLTEGNLTGDWATGGFQGTGTDYNLPRSDDLYYLAKGGKGGGSARAAQEDPNTLQSNAVARVLEVISEGEIVGLENGLKDVFFDDTPVQNADGTYNFKGVDLHIREGLPDQDYIPGFSNLETTNEVATQVTIESGPVTETITDPDVTRARVTIRLPALWKQNTENGDLKEHQVAITISVQANGGGFSPVVNKTFYGKCTSPYEEDFDIALPAGGAPWDIRVTRVTADSEEATISTDTYFQYLTEIIDAKLSYPDSALIGMTIDAKQFGSTIPTRGYLIKGIIVEVPTNYNPTTRVYATTGPGTSGGVWDGTFKRAWTDNPAWVYRDVLINNRYGLGRYLGTNPVDKWGLYVIAQYCDGLVDDGLGGLEPRFTCNVVIDKQAKALKVLRGLSEMFDAITYWSGSQIILSQDSPADPTLLVNTSNVVNGEFNYPQTTGEDKVYSAWVVSFTDPEERFEQNYVIVQDDRLVREIGWKPLEVAAYACSSRGQALRLGRKLRDNQQYRDRSVTYKCGADHSFAMPGSVLAINDPQFTSKEEGGRVKSATVSGMVLDRAYPFTPGRTYTLSWMTRAGTVKSTNITNPATTTDTVSFVGSVASLDVALPDTIWSLESDVVKAQEFRLMTVAEEGSGEYKILAILHDKNKYARIEQGLMIDPENVFDVPSGPLRPPIDIGFREYFKVSGDSTIPSVLISWPSSTDPRVVNYDMQVRYPGQQNWNNLTGGGFLWRELTNVEEGSYSFRVRGIGTNGLPGPWYIEEGVELHGPNLALPTLLLTYRVDSSAVQTVLSWTLSAYDPRPIIYEVYYGTTNVFADADSLGRTYAREWIVTRSGWYFVVPRYMDVAGTPASQQITVEDLPLVDISTIAGRTPEEVVADIDSNALTVATDLLSQAAWRASTEALLYIEGGPIAPFVTSMSEIVDNNVLQLSLMGSVNGSATAFILSGSTIVTDGAGLNAKTLSTIRTEHDGSRADIVELFESFDGQSARAALNLDVNGYVLGWEATNSGVPETSSFIIHTPNFAIIDPAHGLTSPRFVFSVTGGVVRMYSVEVNTLAANTIQTIHLNSNVINTNHIQSDSIAARHMRIDSIETDNLVDNSITNMLRVADGSSRLIPNNYSNRTVTTAVFNKASSGSYMRVSWALAAFRSGSSQSYNYEIELWIDGVLRRTFNHYFAGLFGHTAFGTTVVSGIGLGSRTVELRVKAGQTYPNGSNNIYCNNSEMTIEEIKR